MPFIRQAFYDFVFVKRKRQHLLTRKKSKETLDCTNDFTTLFTVP